MAFVAKAETCSKESKKAAPLEMASFVVVKNINFLCNYYVGA